MEMSYEQSTSAWVFVTSRSVEEDAASVADWLETRALEDNGLVRVADRHSEEKRCYVSFVVHPQRFLEYCSNQAPQHLHPLSMLPEALLSYNGKPVDSVDSLTSIVWDALNQPRPGWWINRAWGNLLELGEKYFLRKATTAPDPTEECEEAYGLPYAREQVRRVEREAAEEIPPQEREETEAESGESDPERIAKLERVCHLLQVLASTSVFSLPFSWMERLSGSQVSASKPAAGWEPRTPEIRVTLSDDQSTLYVRATHQLYLRGEGQSDRNVLSVFVEIGSYLIGADGTGDVLISWDIRPLRY